MKASGYAREQNDYYVEPAWSVDALLQVETLEGMSWDPACGGGTIPKRLEAHGLEARGSDIVNRGYKDELVYNFFTSHVLVENIVSNPPYGVLQAWIERSLMLASKKVCILARLAFLEGQERQAFFKENPPSRIWVSSKRISMPPGGTDIPAKGGTAAYAWFVWDKVWFGPPVLGWLPLPEVAEKRSP